MTKDQDHDNMLINSSVSSPVVFAGDCQLNALIVNTGRVNVNVKWVKQARSEKYLVACIANIKC